MTRLLPFLRFVFISFALTFGTYRASTQVLMPLPAHSSIFPGSVRGYWFTAPTNFTITRLRVSAEAGTGLQYIHVFKINDAVPVVYPTSSTNFTTLSYIQGAPNGVLQNVNIPVVTGDLIGILGAAGATMNSYSPATPAPQPSTINGFPVSLARLLYQGDIITTAAPNYSTEPASGSISRVEMWYTVGPPCDTPLTTTVSNVTYQSANMSWTPPGIATSFEYAVTTSATPPSSGTPITGSTYSTGNTLASATTYYFHLRSACSAAAAPFSTWVTRKFTTLQNNGCFPPSALTVTQLHPYGAVVNWPPVASATSYEWELGLDPNPPTVTLLSSSGTALGKQGLTPNTTYFVHVRSRCGANRVSLSWATISFTTPDGPPLAVGAIAEGFLQAYPNPAGESVTLLSAKKPAPGARVVLKDVAGRAVAERAIHTQETAISLRGIPPGIYFLHYADAGSSAVMRIQKQ